MGLLGSVIGFGEGFCDDKLGDVDLILEKVRDGVFDVSARKERSLAVGRHHAWNGVVIEVKQN